MMLLIPMTLHTRLVDNGLQLTTALALMEPPKWHTFPVPSEQFLRTIEGVVVERGGWQTVTDWVTSVEGNSFTSLRGLLTLANTLVPLHGITLWTVEGEGTHPLRAAWPLSPRYHMEPNVTARSTAPGVAKP